MLVPLFGFTALEVNSLRVQQKTETKRRQVGAAGGKVTVEKRVPGWLASLAGDNYHSFLDESAIIGVSMTRQKIGDAQVAALTDLPHLVSLNLEDSHVTSAGLKTIAELTSLKNLNLLNTKVTDLSALSKLPNLESMKIDFCMQIEAEHLEALAQFPKLRVLGAGGLRLRDAGVAAIAKCTGLEWLDIRGSQLSDTGLQPLQSLKQLKYLTLTYSTFNDADLEAFKKAVPDCQVLL